MDSFIKDLTSLSWWFTVALAGIAVNIVSAYLKPRLDNYLSRISVKQRTKRDSERQQKVVRLTLLTENPLEQVMTGIEVLRKLVIGVMYSVFAVTLWIGGAASRDPLVAIVLFAPGSVSFVIAFIYFHSTTSDVTLINEIRKAKYAAASKEKSLSQNATEAK
jgi:hypothetical protein